MTDSNGRPGIAAAAASGFMEGVGQILITTSRKLSFRIFAHYCE